MGAPGHPPCTRGTGHSGHLPPSKPLLQHSGRPAALLSGKLITRPPMQQAAILCALPLGSASRNGSHRQQAGGLHRGSAGRGQPGPPGVNAVQFVVLPFHSSGSSGRPPSASALGTPIQGGLPWGLSVPLCSALYSPCILCICQKNCKSSRESQFVRNGKIG